jgi:hypothetical protein
MLLHHSVISGKSSFSITLRFTFLPSSNPIHQSKVTFGSAITFPQNPKGTAYLLFPGCARALVFPLDSGASLDVNKYALLSDVFEIVVNKPTWVGYVVSGSGSINPI